jgi:hypothetical protein
MKLSTLTNEELIEFYKNRCGYGISDYVELLREFVKRLKERQLELFPQK